MASLPWLLVAVIIQRGRVLACPVPCGARRLYRLRPVASLHPVSEPFWPVRPRLHPHLQAAFLLPPRFPDLPYFDHFSVLKTPKHLFPSFLSSSLAAPGLHWDNL